MEIQERITDASMGAGKSGNVHIKASDFNDFVKDCLIEVKNFDVDGKKQNLKADDKLLSLIPIPARIEIATAIINECFLSDDQVKN